MRLSPCLLLISVLGCSENELAPTNGADAVAPRIEVDPPLLDFGNPPAGEVVARSFDILSVGDADLLVSDIVVDGTAGFSVPGLFWTQLDPDAVLTVQVDYTSLGDEKASQLLVYSDDPANPVVPVDLLVGDALGVLRITPNPVDFGTTGVGVSTYVTAELSNQGTGPLRLDSLRVDGEAFAIEAAPVLPLVLEPGDSVPVDMSYTPFTLNVDQQGVLWADSDALVSDSPALLIGKTDFGSLSGRICDPEGTGWVTGARVWVGVDLNGDDEPDVISEDWTDADGRFQLDGLVAGLVVVNVEKGSFTTTFNVDLPGGGVYELPEEQCLEQGDIEIAVIPGTYDNIGSLLNTIGLDYTVETPDLLGSLSRMEDYDLIFVPCAAVPDPNAVDDAAVRDYVFAGNSIYVSDLSLYSMVNVFPDEYRPDPGSFWSSTTADILDETLVVALGTDNITINLETGVTPALPDGDPDVESAALLEALGAPVTVRSRYGAGTAVFTSFHTSATLSPDMIVLFKEIVLSM